MRQRSHAFHALFFVFATLPITFSSASAANPEGDVLRPDRLKSTPWYLGLDLGAQYARYFGTHVYLAGNPLNGAVPLWSRFEDGDGFGAVLRAVVDIPVGERVGIVGKLGYAMRNDTYTNTFDNPIFHLDPTSGFPATATLDAEMDVTVRFVTVDILLRWQLSKRSWYALAGLSYASLLGNNASFSQCIVQPQNVSYVGIDGLPTGVRAVELSDLEINGFETSRMAVTLGVGTWIPLSKNVFFTPELCFDYPFSAFLDKPGEPLAFIPASDMRFMTVTLTAGLRFGM